ncbi:hypothetical protein AVEN_232397-1 [Araneus ventricosus]|uniref:Uncharacterized protein n=1 Tax=Araneus ventricosus TaxID=182803 RepID=A0A4Y2CU15_ARAVE|nr:hypothetical protein AVEN_232397-1 [Araneus ventricosus]
MRRIVLFFLDPFNRLMTCYWEVQSERYHTHRDGLTDTLLAQDVLHYCCDIVQYSKFGEQSAVSYICAIGPTQTEFQKSFVITSEYETNCILRDSG